MSEQFSSAERSTFYHIVESRRDVRAFRPDPVPENVLFRILNAAHHAPSVGFMQPWNFIVIQDPATRAAIKSVFVRENDRAAAMYTGDRAALYGSLKLEGIEEAPIKIYSAARTVADCFKFRNKIGLDVAIEALRLARQRKRAQNRELLHFARLLRVENAMSPYLQAIE